ncbi:MAG: GTP-binding protein [Thermoplasmata archaeon]|nr:GTP-binding protein [Thermoplasmata archaeon]
MVKSNMVKRNYIKKICLLGDGAVGKTSLIRRFVFDEFKDEYITTIGTKVTKKELAFIADDGTDIHLNLMIHDILGQAKFEGLHRNYYRGSEGGFIVIDMTRKETLERVRWWYDGFKAVAGDVPITLIGNKNDLVDEHEITPDILSETAKDLDCSYYLASARSGENVERFFNNMGRRVCR